MRLLMAFPIAPTLASGASASGVDAVARACGEAVDSLDGDLGLLVAFTAGLDDSREAAAQLESANVHFRPATIGAWARAGRLQSIKLGGRRFVRRGQVRSLVAPRRRVQADQLQPGLFAELQD